MRQTTQPRSATSAAIFGSPRSAVTSLTMLAPASSAAAATAAFDVSIDSRAPAPASPSSTGTTRRSSSASLTGSAPGRVDSPPMSRIAAPCATSARPWAIAASGSSHSPPSENESGVTLTTPMTTGSGRWAVIGRTLARPASVRAPSSHSRACREDGRMERTRQPTTRCCAPRPAGRRRSASSTAATRRRCSCSSCAAPAMPRRRPTSPPRCSPPRCQSAHRFRPGPQPAVAWLYAIANHKLASSRRRGRVADRARRRLGMEPIVLTDENLERVEALADAQRAGEVVGRSARAAARRSARGDPPARPRRARLRGHRRRAALSTAVIRQRVSRGLTRCATNCPRSDHDDPRRARRSARPRARAAARRAAAGAPARGPRPALAADAACSASAAGTRGGRRRHRDGPAADGRPRQRRRRARTRSRAVGPGRQGLPAAALPPATRPPSAAAWSPTLRTPLGVIVADSAPIAGDERAARARRLRPRGDGRSPASTSSTTRASRTPPRRARSTACRAASSPSPWRTGARSSCVAYDDAGRQVAHVGTHERPARRPLSHDEAVAQGDPGGVRARASTPRAATASTAASSAPRASRRS